MSSFLREAMVAALVGGAAATCLPGQGLQLVTINLDPVPEHNSYWSYGPLTYIPGGVVAFPILQSLGFNGYFHLTATPTSVTVDAQSQSGTSFSVLSGSEVDLVTYLIKPAPARITIHVQSQVSIQQTFPVAPIFDCGVDLGADGSDEFTNTSPTSAGATLTTWCDDIGAPVRWHQNNQGFYMGPGFLRVTSALTLQFDDPVQEQTYGQTCQGKLGCQYGAGTFDRVLVASLPGNSTFAWLMGGVTQWNVTLAGFTCPLLVQPQFILGVPLHDGPNGRRYVDFDCTFPPVPGLTFYVQGIAISNNTFVGTNGVIVRT